MVHDFFIFFCCFCLFVCLVCLTCSVAYSDLLNLNDCPQLFHFCFHDSLKYEDANDESASIRLIDQLNSQLAAAQVAISTTPEQVRVCVVVEIRLKYTYTFCFAVIIFNRIKFLFFLLTF
jgi:hypothetical protein